MMTQNTLITDEMISAMNMLATVLEDLGHTQDSEYYLQPRYYWRNGDNIMTGTKLPKDHEIQP